MPLSDAAKALLQRKMSGAKPLGQPAPEPDVLEQEEVTEHQQGFRDRAAREDERFRLATDGEFWIAFCFRKPGHPAAFLARFGLTMQPGTRYVEGPALAAHIGDRTRLTAAQRVKQLLRIKSQRADDLLTAAADAGGQLPDDLLKDVPVTGHLAVDSLAELQAIHRALLAPPPPKPADVLDSPHWFVAYFPSREPKEEFLTAAGLDVLGDKYLDGQQAARILDVDL